MSMVQCDECKESFDSDVDPDCFVDVGEKTVVLCVFCREDEDAIISETVSWNE